MNKNQKLKIALTLAGLMVAGSVNAVQYHFVMPMDGLIASSEPAAATEPDTTVRCEGMTAGATFDQDGTTYTVADKSTAASLGASACTSNITDMNMLFAGNYNFDQDISTWDTSGVTDMSFMFADAHYFNQDISNWDVSSVVDMSTMFANAYHFNQDLSGWCVSNISAKPTDFYILQDNSGPFAQGYTGEYQIYNWAQPVWGTCPAP